MDGENAGAGLENSAEALDLANEGVAYGLVIDDPFVWNAQCCEAGGVGFDFAELGGIEPLKAFEAVLLTAFLKITKSMDFGVVRGDNDFSADFVCDSMLAAEVGHEPNPTNGESGFQRPGFVVEAAVEDATVVRALMAAGAILFFKDANGDPRLAEQQLAGDG